MTLERALNKFERHGYHHERIGQRVIATKPGQKQVIDLILDRREVVVATRVRNNTDKDDVQYNKFAGEWFPNVSQAIRFISTGRTE